MTKTKKYSIKKWVLKQLINPLQVKGGKEEKMKKRILVVDDNKDNRDLIYQILSREGYLVEEAEDGREALQKLTDRNFNLVISDIEMPEVTGIQLAAEIKLWREPLPVILMSGGIKEIKGLADFFLPKPFKGKDLLSIVALALGE